MKFGETELAGAYVVEPERHEDDRGFFARSYCADEFRAHELCHEFPQSNISYNLRRGTLRGIHFQQPPAEEPKLVRCTRGAIFDVIVDLRRESPSRGEWLGLELTAENHRALYVPEGFGHGFQTLRDDSEVFYQMGERYRPDLASGVRYDDPEIGIRWPIAGAIVSKHDLELPMWKPGS